MTRPTSQRHRFPSRSASSLSRAACERGELSDNRQRYQPTKLQMLSEIFLFVGKKN